MADARAAAPRRWSFPIARIAGIEIRVHVTFFVLVALFVVAGTAPKGPGVVSALGWLVLIFASVVFHELAHCLVGRRHGAVVHEIDLLPIGGVSRLEHLPETPSDELAMAIAGPLASAALGIAAGCAAILVSQHLTPIDLVRGPILPRLAFVNLLLAAFNMLPAFPLDGGRVLRALLERRYDLERATRIAATTGRAFAVALVVVGVFVDFWLLLIGVFVYFGADVEERATLIHLRLTGRRVSDAMVLDPTVIDAATPLPDLRQLVRRVPQRAFPVVVDGRLVGLVDVASITFASDRARAGDVALTDVEVLAPNADLEASLPALEGSRVGANAVVHGERVVGLLRVEDVDRITRDRFPDPRRTRR
jgi:Zn-dependent protease